jgi:hypothetical protein
MANKRRGANPKVKRPARVRVEAWVYVVGVAIVLVTVLGIGLATRTPPSQPIQKAIVGKWVYAKGGELDFNADGSGSIPAVGDVGAYTFAYSFQDDTHLVMKVDQQTTVVRIKLVGDKLTWYTADPNVTYEYTRAK